MSLPNLSDGMLGEFGACSSGSALYVLDVSTTTASITLPNGQYRMFLKSGTTTVGVVCKIGGSATIPTTGNTAASEFAFSGGDRRGARFAITAADTTKTLDVILSAAASADTVYITKVG